MRVLSSWLGILTLLSLVVLATAQIPSASASAACSTISAAGIETLNEVTDALNPQFIDAQSRYWSAANADLHPACVVFPTSADEVSQIVTILQNSAGVNFAVKSGGHNPNIGFSSTDGGVLISMSNMSSTVLSSDQTTADIGPGARWVEVAKALDPYGVTVVSGRIGDVGVGGLTLGGGLSFLSGEYGLVCDNVINYEVVLANASIINANSSSSADLYWALKGGGNQFGIVTKFTMKTHVIGQVWAGIRSYDATAAEALLDAVEDFNENYDSHPEAAIIVTGEITIDSLLEIFVVFYFYDGPIPPPGVFDAFNVIPAITDSVQVQSYYDLINSDDTTNLYGLRYLIRGATLPNLPGTTGKDLYKYHYSQWKEYVMTTGILNPGFIFNLAYQPMSYIIPEHSVAAGGNALGMKPSDGDRMWMEYSTSWLTAAGDDAAHSMAINITDSIETYAKATYANVPSSHYQSGDLDESYENDGYDRLASIQKTVDPDGFFPGRTGGFKFT